MPAEPRRVTFDDGLSPQPSAAPAPTRLQLLAQEAAASSANAPPAGASGEADEPDAHGTLGGVASRVSDAVGELDDASADAAARRTEGDEASSYDIGSALRQVIDAGSSQKVRAQCSRLPPCVSHRSAPCGTVAAEQPDALLRRH